jgi:hypothetical protein
MTDPEIIHATVVADVTLASLLGSFEGSPAIFPVVLPPDPPLPAIAYYLVSQPTDFTQADDQYRWPRWRFRIYSLFYRDLVPIATALARIFGDQSQTPFTRSHIEYPASAAEGHEMETQRYWRAMDVVAFMAAGGASQ